MIIGNLYKVKRECLNKGVPSSKLKYDIWLIVYNYREGKMKKYQVLNGMKSIKYKNYVSCILILAAYLWYNGSMSLVKLQAKSDYNLF